MKIAIECIQMVVGYLDTFVFEELGFAVRPVVDGIDGVTNWDGYKKGKLTRRLFEKLA